MSVSRAYPKTILVVEDDPRLSKLVRLTLESDGYRVITAQDGEGALRAVTLYGPDLLVLDIILPGGLDGYDVCRTVRSFSEVPVIMLTSKARESDKLAGFGAGADDYISKPFSCPELRARVKAVLHRASSARGDGASQSLTIGELHIDFAKRRVYIRDMEIDLTPTEYRVLCLLAQNPGKVLLHEELLAAVWGAEYRDEYQYLRNYISNLRKKIEADPATPRYILSRPGMGYFLTDAGNLTADT